MTLIDGYVGIGAGFEKNTEKGQNFEIDELLARCE